jgi:hypothetical protein
MAKAVLPLVMTAAQAPFKTTMRVSTTRSPQLTGGGQLIAQLPALSPSALCLLSSSFCFSFYGVGAGDDSVPDGDSAADGDASVFGAFFLAACFLGDGEGEAFVAAVVEVAVVPCCCVQETTNAMPIKAVIKDKTIFFIVCG